MVTKFVESCIRRSYVLAISFQSIVCEWPTTTLRYVLMMDIHNSLLSCVHVDIYLVIVDWVGTEKKICSWDVRFSCKIETVNKKQKMGIC